jgi:hypothetical protein
VAVVATLIGALAVTAVAYIVLAALTSGSVSGPVSNDTPDQTELLRLALATTAGAGAVVALVITYRRQHLAEADTGEASRQLGEAAAQLGAEEPVARLAGAYAIAAIADREPRLRVQAAQVLCAALRLPPNVTSDADDEVRRLIGEIICQRLTKTHRAVWTHDISLVGARLVDFTLQDADVTARLDFAGATFTGLTSLDRCHFHAKVRLDEAHFRDSFSCQSARFDDDFDAVACFFSGDVYFNKTQARSFATLSESRIESTLWLKGLQAEHLAANGVVVAESLLLESADIRGNVELRDVQCGKVLVLDNATFGGNLSWAGLNVGDGWSLEGLRTQKMADLSDVHPLDLATELRARLGP